VRGCDIPWLEGLIGFGDRINTGKEDIMDQATMNFWQNHSMQFLEMAVRTDRRQVLKHADGYGVLTRECGDTVEIFLVVRNSRIQSAAFETNGCVYALVCANAVVHLAEGKSLQEALELAPESVVNYLETLPEEETHCAEQAVQVLRLAILDARENERQPWKKFYTRR
jgi:nitrogen fixation NifU-like protein